MVGMVPAPKTGESGRCGYREGASNGYRRQGQNKAEELKGKAKESAGDATDNEQLQAEGRGDQASGNLKQAGEKVKDAFKD